MIELPGWTIRINNDAEYEEIEFPCNSGGNLLLFSNDVFKIQGAAGRLLDAEGLIKTDPHSKTLPLSAFFHKIESLHTSLLTVSHEILLKNDLLGMEIRFTEVNSC